MTTTKNLWGNIPSKSTTNVVSPFAILEEQGKQLETATKSKLTGKTVRGGQYGNKFVIDFYIYAPTLGQYTYPLLKVIHGIDMYPLQIRQHGEHDEVDCRDKDDFEQKLQSILSSHEVYRVIESLLNQMPD